MRDFNRKTLVVIGAGPKGIATAVKSKVLEEYGIPVDRVILIEKNNVAANWSGEFGYTNGEMKLGTSPEKDVVFPIETDVGNSDLNRKIRKRLMQFTWISFLVDTQRYSDWVDRGRPAPCHLFWTEYLRWVSAQLEPQVKIVTGHVTQIDLNALNNRWALKLKDSPEVIYADRLMLTGPGHTRLDFLKSSQLPANCFDLESFWSSIKIGNFPKEGRLAIIGAGENAASALLALSKHSPSLQVDVISPKGFISTRAESFYENQMYSQPERNQWTELEVKDRIDFIERTDLGVFSVHAMQLLNEQVRHRIVPGRVKELTSEKDGIRLKMDYAKKSLERTYDQVVIASGFDQISTLKSLLSKRALAKLEASLDSNVTQLNLTQSIQADLSVNKMIPTLHLPMLAGLTQGPGFANLSCLGRLSDRIVCFEHKVETLIAGMKLMEEAL